MVAESGKSQRGVIFDHDGVLVHSEQNWFVACQIALSEHGIKLLEEHRVEIAGRGKLSVYFVEKFGLSIPVPQLSRKMREHFIVISERTGILPAEGAVEAVKRLSPEFPLAIASGSATEGLVRTVKALGVENDFKALVGGDKVARGKPDPDVYIKAAEELGVPPLRCTAIEDTTFGVAAAKRAGMWCIGIPDRLSPVPQDLSEADFQLKSLHELNREHILYGILHGR